MSQNTIPTNDQKPSWPIFTGSRQAPSKDQLPALPKDPPWRQFGSLSEPRATTPRDVEWNDAEAARRGTPYQSSDAVKKMVNAALFLKRPLLIGGKPGNGKSSLAYAVAQELGLGAVLRWNITSRSTLKEGLYDYDALGRLNDFNIPDQKEKARDIGQYIRLGPLGTALLPHSRPRVLLIDEIDKSDIDLPNDLLNALEEGTFTIPELFRQRGEKDDVDVLPQDGSKTVKILEGVVHCTQFPFVVMTSNGERDFSPPLLRRCLRLNLAPPSTDELKAIVHAQLFPDKKIGDNDAWPALQVGELIGRFEAQSKAGIVATDQLLNAVHMVLGILPDGHKMTEGEGKKKIFNDQVESMINSLLMNLGNSEATT